MKWGACVAEKVKGLGSDAWDYRTVLRRKSAWPERCRKSDCSKQRIGVASAAAAAAAAAGETAVGAARELGEGSGGTKYVTVVDAVAVGTNFASIRTRCFEERSRCRLVIVGGSWSVECSRCEMRLVGASLSGIGLELWCRTQFPLVHVPVKYRLEPRPMCSHRLTVAADRTTM